MNSPSCGRRPSARTSPLYHLCANSAAPGEVSHLPPASAPRGNAVHTQRRMPRTASSCPDGIFLLKFLQAKQKSIIFTRPY